MFSSREIISTLDVQLQLLKPIMCGGGCYVVSEPGLPPPPAGRSVRKTYFSDNDNEKGKYSDGNSPIRRVGSARVENIKGPARTT